VLSLTPFTLPTHPAAHKRGNSALRFPRLGFLWQPLENATLKSHFQLPPKAR